MISEIFDESAWDEVAGFDLVEQAHVGRVKRVVEVEDPGGDVVEVVFGHRPF